MAETAWRFLRTPEGACGCSILLALLLCTLLAQVLFPYDPLASVATPFIAPFTDPDHILGTDMLGRDLAAQLAHGAIASTTTAFSVMAVSLTIGAIVGAIAGYFGGLTDEICMLFANAAQTVSPFLLALALISVVGPTLPVIVLALSAGSWAGPARVVRAEALAVKARAFVDVSQMLGRSRLAIAFRVVLPNTLTPLIALSAIIAASALLSESALSFLGLADRNHASWGTIAADGRAAFFRASYILALPGIAIVVTVLAINLVGEGLAKALRPDSNAQ